MARKTPASLFWIGLAVAPSVYAQTQPDAGMLKQQVERPQTTPVPGSVAPLPKAPSARAPEPRATVITVKEFRITGNTLVEQTQLADALKDYLNRPLDYSQLQEAAVRVSEVFRSSGWIVHTFLPVQDVTDGTVTIDVVEARFGGVRVQKSPDTRVPMTRVLGVIAAQVPLHQPISTTALDRALLLADDLPGIVVAGALSEGEQASTTQLLLKAVDEPRMEGEIALSNHGARATGSAQLLAALQVSSPFGLTDQWSATALESRGSRYLRVGEMISVGNDGWKIGGSLSDLAYHLVSPEFSALKASGNANTVGLEISYPIVRSRSANLLLVGQLDHKSFDNASQGSTVSSYRSKVASAGLKGSFADGVSGGGSNQFAFIWSRGWLNLGGSPNRLADSRTTRTEGQFDKWQLSLSRLQSLTSALQLSATYNLQLASKNLDSSEKFYLGGANGLWAYPTGEGAGSEGQRLTVELRGQLSERMQLTGFHDYGRIRVNRDNSFAGAVVRNNLSYRGIGFGLNWRLSEGTSVKIQWSHRLGDNPDPQPTGMDRDGTLVKNRVWFNLTQQF